MNHSCQERTKDFDDSCTELLNDSLQQKNKIWESAVGSTTERDDKLIEKR